MHVDHYGLHRTDGGIPLLVQQGRVDHALDIHMEFEVQVRTRRPCTHRIDLDSAMEHPILDQFRHDPLWQAMLPIPRVGHEKPLFLEDTEENMSVLMELTKLSSPGTFSIMVPFWTQRPHVHGQTLNETNLQPLILYGFRLEHAMPLVKVMEASRYSPRRLILFGSRSATPTVGLTERITTSVRLEDLRDVSLESVGAYALKSHMLAT